MRINRATVYKVCVVVLVLALGLVAVVARPRAGQTASVDDRLLEARGRTERPNRSTRKPSAHAIGRIRRGRQPESGIS